MPFCQKCGKEVAENEEFCPYCGEKTRLVVEKVIEKAPLITEDRKNLFFYIIATIGAVLIFVGVAWLIAKNWHQIPDAQKVIILVFSTLLAFCTGFFMREKDYEGPGRALTTLGALLYILTIFLIAQIYATPSGLQGYAWLLLLAWTIIFLTAYFLDSPENLVLSMIVFFPWVIIQYFATISEANMSSEGEAIIGLILIFFSAGALLYGLSALHNSLKHRFTNIYRFWTVLYFLLIFYILSFQSFLPIVADYSFESGAFSIFLILFIMLCFLGFIIGVLLAVSKDSISIKEVLGFIGVLVILFILILSTKSGAGLIGNCYAKGCYDFQTSSACASAPDELICGWQTNDGMRDGFCAEINCRNFQTEAECSSGPNTLSCDWQNGICLQQGGINARYKSHEICRNYNNQKSGCLDQSLCKWSSSKNFSGNNSLPTSLWLLWIVINFAFIGFIVLIIWYGQYSGSTNIVNIGLLFFIMEIITRYIGFWFDFKGYFAFSILAILGGILLIFGAWFIPRWRRNLLEETKQEDL